MKNIKDTFKVRVDFREVRLSELIICLSKRNVDKDPEFLKSDKLLGGERDAAWDADLIDSLLLRFAIPSFTVLDYSSLGYDKEGSKIIDGKRRLSALYRFIYGECTVWNLTLYPGKVLWFYELDGWVRERLLSTILKVVDISVPPGEDRDEIIRRYS